MTHHVQALAIYPVKGLRGLDVQEAVVERQGLRHDRRWAVIRADGAAHTQRDLPAMARIDAVPQGGGLRLERAGHGGVDATPDGPAVTLTIWGTPVPAIAANPAASAWLSRALGTDCTLAYMQDPAARLVTPDLARPGDVVSLADGFPLLVVNQASLDDLNTRLGNPVPAGRFRPNLVLAGQPDAWAEDGWSALEAGDVRLRLASACVRCTVITLDQATGEKPARTEPLKTLGTFRRDGEGHITFGWNAVPSGSASSAWATRSRRNGNKTTTPRPGSPSYDDRPFDGALCDVRRDRRPRPR